MLAVILDFSDRTMIKDNHPPFSCTSDIPLTIYAIIFPGPPMHTGTPSVTGVSDTVHIYSVVGRL